MCVELCEIEDVGHDFYSNVQGALESVVTVSQRLVSIDESCSCIYPQGICPLERMVTCKVRKATHAINSTTSDSSDAILFRPLR
jgi:hypothetical protein